MATSKVYLSGGPCNGRTVSADEIQGGLVAFIACGGGFYTPNTAGKLHNGDVIFDYAGKNKPQPPNTVGGSGAYAPNVTRSWSHLQHSINRNLPTAERSIDHAMRRTLQRLSHNRRVR